MASSNVQRLLLLPAGALVAATLAGCTGTTYGTGVSQEEQTLKDVMSIAALGSEKKPPIDYKPRGGIVAPPNNNLPVPGSAPDQTASIADDPNWPKDPDEAKRKQAEAEAAAPVGQAPPNFILPKGQTSYSVAAANQTQTTAEKRAAGRKAWLELHKGKAGSYDANGNPTRKYLTEPPVSYREPDPTQPMTEPPKAKVKWDLSKLWPF
jgi:hypothetical protein